jgi:hypothetical protein
MTIATGGTEVTNGTSPRGLIAVAAAGTALSAAAGSLSTIKPEQPRHGSAAAAHSLA